MHSLTIVCFAAIATIALSTDIGFKKDLFTYSNSNPHFRLNPKDINQLENEISPDSPLILFIRSGQGAHDKNEQINSLYQRFKQAVLISTIGDVNSDVRFQYFDPDLDSSGKRQAQNLKDELQGWMQFLQCIEPIQYITSPLSRSIETALRAVPDVKLIVDEGVRPRITPMGIDLRRNLNSALTIGDDCLESVQTKFKHYKDRLVFQMADSSSDNIYHKFGYISDEDPNINNDHLETEEELAGRVSKWLNMLNPRSKEMDPKLTQLLHKILPNPFQKKSVQSTPKVYVVFTHQNFISAIIKRFYIDVFENDSLNFCEVVPVVLNFGTSSPASGSASSTY